MRYIATSQHKNISLKINQTLDYQNKIKPGLYSTNAIDTPPAENAVETAELAALAINMERLYNLYKQRKEELELLTEEYLQMQQQVRIKLRKQQIIIKKHLNIISGSKRPIQQLVVPLEDNLIKR